MFSMSRDLLLLAGVKPVVGEPKGFVYLGSVEANVLEEFVGVKGFMFYRCVPSTEDLYNYPLIFFVSEGG